VDASDEAIGSRRQHGEARVDVDAARPLEETAEQHQAVVSAVKEEGRLALAGYS